MKNMQLIILFAIIFFSALIYFWPALKSLMMRSQSTQTTKNINQNKRITVVNDQIIETGELMDIIDPVWYGISIYEGEEKYKEDSLKFSQPQRYVFAMVWYIAEVNNGGHDQFYFNSTGIVWKDALAGFKFFKMDKYAEILKESADLMGGNPNLDREKRQRQLDTLHPNFNDLDNRLYTVKYPQDFDSVILEYIKKHRKEFYFPSVK